MIAKIMAPFSNEMSLFRKIEYNIKKLEKGDASFLHDNSFKNDVRQLFSEMKEVASLNDRVERKYCEVVLSLAPGEDLEDERFRQMAMDYMGEMGYAESCYNIWRHSDKPHAHIHILFTTTDYNGSWIEDHYSRKRSQKISRELEVKYGLKQTNYNQFRNEPLTQVKAREYYFDNALKKGLRAYNSKVALEDLLLKGGHLDQVRHNKYTNSELEVILGKELYTRIGEILEKEKLFKKLYKEEMIGILDSTYSVSANRKDFFQRLEDLGLYVRMVSQKGEHSYVYGIPEASIYFKDKQLPQTYRYENLLRFGSRECKREILDAEQKTIIYNRAFIALNRSKDFDQYCMELSKLNVTLKVLQNKSGIYGLSFKLKDIDKPIEFKASEITRKLTYRNVINYFTGQNRDLTVLVKENPVFIKELTEKEQDAGYGIPNMNSRGEKGEDFLSVGKKKKKKKGRSNDLTV